MARVADDKDDKEGQPQKAMRAAITEGRRAAAPPDVAKAVAWTNAGASSKERTDTKSQSRGASAPRGRR